MKVKAVIGFLVMSIAVAQMDLSTPTSSSVLAKFETEPQSVDLYISGTFIGSTPVSVRINPDTATPYELRVFDGEVLAHSDTVTLSSDSTVEIQLAAGEGSNRTTITPEPTESITTSPIIAAETEIANPPSEAPLNNFTPVTIGAALLALTFAVLLFIQLNQHRKTRRYRKITDLEAAEQQIVNQIEEKKRAKEQISAELFTQRVKLDEDIGSYKNELEEKVETLKSQINELKTELEPLEDEAQFIENGLFEPLYDFDSSEDYKTELKAIRQEQKMMVKEKTAVEWHTQWYVGDSRTKGKQMEGQVTKLILRAFNGECDALITKVKYSNLLQIEKRIKKLYESTNKLGKANNCALSEEYLEHKLNELYLVHEFADKVQAEKEEQRQIREQMREEERAQREIEKATMEAEKEEIRFEKALERARKEVGGLTGEKHAKREADILRLQALLDEAHENKSRATSRAQMTRSGYVYIISNLGSFGENIYKIGMTRRLNPMERVYELGDASVPFSFDVHAMIFSKDAPTLENALHKTFDHRRVNRVNQRKEFFQVTLEEIRSEVQKHKADIRFTMKAEAEDFRKSLVLKTHKDVGSDNSESLEVREFSEPETQKDVQPIS